VPTRATASSRRRRPRWCGAWEAQRQSLWKKRAALGGALGGSGRDAGGVAREGQEAWEDEEPGEVTVHTRLLRNGPSTLGEPLMHPSHCA